MKIGAGFYFLIGQLGAKSKQDKKKPINVCVLGGTVLKAYILYLANLIFLYIFLSNSKKMQAEAK